MLTDVKIFTNYGRAASFIPLQYRIHQSLKSLPIPPPGHSTTGFTAAERGNWNRSSSFNHPLQDLSDGFSRIGIQSQPCGDTLAPTETPNYDSGIVSDDQLRDDETFAHLIRIPGDNVYQTYASLKNVHRIKASIGVQGRSRSPRCITGLKIEYFDNRSPSVVGQWMDEMELLLELSSDETVRSLSIWLTSFDFSHDSQPPFRMCRVTAIHIETTLSREVTFRAPSGNSKFNGQEFNRYLGGFGEELTAISWVFDGRCDRVRAIISIHRPLIILPAYSVPFYHSQRLYFFVPDSSGCVQPAVAIQVFWRGSSIIGIAFVYPSGQVVRAGESETASQETFTFPSDSRVVSLSFLHGKGTIRGIKFEMESDGQQAIPCIETSANPTDKSASADTIEWEKSTIWCKNAGYMESYERRAPGTAHVYKPPPESELVGIFVGCLLFSHCGGVYERE
ncbi:uncharacterized protein N7483_001992 [Penicillium malachiteum]|uniref:uncharacterized protein n=1 Tax=Penicillium malachiteum TaxID=1324776 RepID=UPI0025485753|nr:uncharacterized protein N7483_001992 [Penicillium malachiteum]KAJ5736867.1 hypothetical protein N7483_001992 [Penicillium malachiteum]